MSGQLTANDVARQLAELARDLDLTVRQMEQADREAVDKRHAADLAQSRAFLNAQGSVEQRKHAAFVEVERLLHEAEVAEALVRHLRRRLDAVKIRIDVGRSYGAAIRAEIALGQAS